MLFISHFPLFVLLNPVRIRPAENVMHKNFVKSIFFRISYEDFHPTATLGFCFR